MRKTSSLLVFSDNSETKSTFIAFGSAANYTVQFSEKNSYALRLLIEQKVDLIIVEILCPQMSEVNFVDQLYRVAKGVPIIVVSSLFHDTKDIVFGNRIAAFILKPLSYEKLMETAEKIFQEREEHAAADTASAENKSTAGREQLKGQMEEMQQLYNDFYIARNQIIKEAGFSAISEAIAFIKEELAGAQIIHKAQELRNLYPFDLQIKKAVNEMIEAQLKAEFSIENYFNHWREKLNSTE